MSKYRVYIKSIRDIDESLVEIFDRFELLDLFKKKVFVKPNMLRPAEPEQAVVTDPELIAHVVSFLIRSGARVMVGDNPIPTRSYTEFEIADRCGYIEAAQGKFRSIGKYTKSIKRPDNMLKEILISKDIADCDILISLPKFRAHDLMTMSLAVKNQFGIIPGGLKPYIHSQFPRLKDFARVLLEIYEIRPPDLIIVDCINIIDGRGKKYAPEHIIIGDNGHAVDHTCALIAGIDPDQIPTLRSAREQGLFDPADVQVHGRLDKIMNYAVPFRFPFRSSIVQSVGQILYRIWWARTPVIDIRKCIDCGACKDVCPAKCIEHRSIDHRKCIKCYCCIEICPNQAIKTKFIL
jgi:uncharacterized protein (DUF362 family)/NAD-dependent dihydropyrimidine dehydrogenase PreA subunit